MAEPHSSLKRTVCAPDWRVLCAAALTDLQQYRRHLNHVGVPSPPLIFITFVAVAPLGMQSAPFKILDCYINSPTMNQARCYVSTTSVSAT